MKGFWLANKNLQDIIATNQVAKVSSIHSYTRLLSTFFFLLMIFISAASVAQVTDDNKLAQYQKTVNERVVKIVNELNISDSTVYSNMVSVISNQYFRVNTIHEESKTTVDEIKKRGLLKEEAEAAIKKEEENKSAKLLQQHGAFIALLKKDLNDSQVEKIKDAMTYRVFPITYAAYQDMLPGLTAEQKDKIFNWLKEARELAMDAESADKKHAVFGKYKGRINNYLSAAGYDMKKEGEEWQKRIKEREEKKTSQQGS